MFFLESYLQVLWQLTMEMAPWLLLGFLMSGLLKVYFPSERVGRYFGKAGWKSHLRAVLFGIPLPLCSCGVIPTGVSLFHSGASKGATNAFLISTPQTGVDSIFATYAMLGWPFAVLRPVAAFFTGLLGGAVSDVVVGKEDGRSVEEVVEAMNCRSSASHESARWKRVLHYGFVEMVQDIAKWLVIGLMLAALISVLVPDDFLVAYLHNVWLEFGVILVLSVPLYVCATGSIPVGLVLLAKGISPGAVLLFLMAGPATNVATMTVIAKTMGRRSLLAYLISIIGGAILFGVVVNGLSPRAWLLSRLPVAVGSEHVSMFGPGLQLFFGLLFSGLVLYALCTVYLGPWWTKRGKEKEEAMISIEVHGMTCHRCKAAVEARLLEFATIHYVEAAPAQNSVQINQGADMDAVIRAIEGLGYSVSQHDE